MINLFNIITKGVELVSMFAIIWAIFCLARRNTKDFQKITKWAVLTLIVIKCITIFVL